MAMTQPESRTVEERLAEVLHIARNHEADPRGLEAPHGHTTEGHRREAVSILAAAKEHGLVIGEGELDAAWKEAEAALPEGVYIYGLYHLSGEGTNEMWPSRWRADAGNAKDRTQDQGAYGITPAAALTELARKFRERA